MTPLSVFDKLIHLQPTVGQKLLTRLDCTWLQGQSRAAIRAGTKAGTKAGAKAEAEAEAEAVAATERGGHSLMAKWLQFFVALNCF